MDRPLLILLAGSNGAGKSTFYEAHLKDLGLPFLNADNLSRDTGLDAYTAASTIAEIRDGFIGRKEGFITETVFSDPVGEEVQVLKKSAEAGFDVTLLYVGIEHPDLSKRRVKTTVQAGGYNVPTEKLKPRYERSLMNLERAIDQLPRVLIYDNSSFKAAHRFLMEFRNGELLRRSGDIPTWALPYLQ